MLNYTYDTVQLVDDRPVRSLYLGHSRDIAETRALLACSAGYLHDYAVIRTETNERVSQVRAQVLRDYAVRQGLL